MNENHTIGQLAKAAEVNVETIRYYERRGLIRVPRSECWKGSSLKKKKHQTAQGGHREHQGGKEREKSVT